MHLVLRKAIPVAAGMAGGSADAAAALVACDALLGHRAEPPRTRGAGCRARQRRPVRADRRHGAGHRPGRAAVAGAVARHLPWVFALADGGLSTPAVYAELDRYRDELPRPALLAALRRARRAAPGRSRRAGATLANDLSRRRSGCARRSPGCWTPAASWGPSARWSAAPVRPAPSWRPTPKQAVRLAAELAGAGVCRTGARAPTDRCPARRRALVASPQPVDGGRRRPAGRAAPGRASARRSPSPSFSKARMSRALVSTWPRSTPWRAQVGSAWCRLCQLSPIEMIASGQTLAERSRVLKGRLPKVWQMLLIDQVTWCSSRDAHQAGPEERLERGLERPAPQPADDGRAGAG